jgi:hypothetical protein
VVRFLNEHFVLYWTNQIPGLYCSAHGGANRFPQEMVDRCPEGAGGGNVRFFVCDVDGRVSDCVLGYWKPPRLLAELKEHDRSHPTEPAEAAQRNLLRRAHAMARGEEIGAVLRRIEEECYTLGKVG